MGIPSSLGYVPVIALLLLSSQVIGQCGPYVGHPFAPDTVGEVHLNQFECGDLTHAVWSTGDTAWAVSAPVGSHWVSLYNGLNLLETRNFEVEQLDWRITDFVYPSAGSVWVSGEAFVPYCWTQVFNFPLCDPVADATVLEVVQDDTLVIRTLSPVACATQDFIFSDLPFGHSYAVRITSPCGESYSDTTYAYDCTGVSLQLELDAATIDQLDGAIAVTGVIPDPTVALPYPAPLAGSFMLLQLPDYTPVLPAQEGTTALWGGLDTGQYIVVFTPELVCQAVQDEVDLTQGIVLGTRASRSDDRPILFPNPVSDRLRWKGELGSVVRIRDAAGRVLHQSKATGWVNVEGLDPGVYHLELQGSGTLLSAPFVKE